LLAFFNFLCNFGWKIRSQLKILNLIKAFWTLNNLIAGKFFNTIFNKATYMNSMKAVSRLNHSRIILFLITVCNYIITKFAKTVFFFSLNLQIIILSLLLFLFTHILFHVSCITDIWWLLYLISSKTVYLIKLIYHLNILILFFLLFKFWIAQYRKSRILSGHNLVLLTIYFIFWLQIFKNSP